MCSTIGNAGYSAIVERLVPHLAKLVSDQQPEVRLAAGEALVDVARHIRTEDMGPRVLTFVLELAHHDEQEDLRMTAAVLLNELAKALGEELCIQVRGCVSCAVAADSILTTVACNFGSL